MNKNSGIPNPNNIAVREYISFIRENVGRVGNTINNEIKNDSNNNVYRSFHSMVIQRMQNKIKR